MTQSVAVQPALAVIDGKATALSTDIARHFGKRHDNVLKSIRLLIKQLGQEHAHNFAQTQVNIEISGALNFEGVSRKSPAYRLTRDGFTLLAMGFTGKQALQFKLAYIDAFNRMEEQLRQPPPAELQEQLQRLRAQLAAHGADYLARHPRAAQVLRYHAIEGLSHIEKARLMGWKTGDSWRAALKELAALGLLEYSPHEGRAAAGRAGMARRQAQGHAQNPSPARQAAQQQAAVRMRQARQRQRQLRLPVGDAPGTGGDNA